MARLAKRRALAALPTLAAGRLTVHLPDGSTHQGGDPSSALHATMWIDDEAFFGEFARRGDIGFGESYMAGHFRTDNLVSLLEIGIRNEAALPQVTWLTRLLNLGNDLQHRLRPNTRAGSRRNIHAHYDLSNELFALFLDPEMVYSAAYYEQADRHAGAGAAAEVPPTRRGGGAARRRRTCSRSGVAGAASPCSRLVPTGAA